MVCDMDVALGALDSEFADVAARVGSASEDELARFAFGLVDELDPVRLRDFTPLLLRKVINGDIHPVYSYLGEAISKAWDGKWDTLHGAAVRRFFMQWWRSTLSEYPAEHDPAELLEFLFQLQSEGGPWLTTWESISTEASDLHLADLVCWWVPDLLNDSRLPVDFGTSRDSRSFVTPWLKGYALERIKMHKERGDKYELALRLLGGLIAEA